MSRDEAAAKERLRQEFGLSEQEAEVYIGALKKGSASGGGETLPALLRRGMLIRATDEKGYLPVHPRLALSNLFRSYGDRSTPEMKEKRRRVDRLTAELILIQESGKGVG